MGGTQSTEADTTAPAVLFTKTGLQCAWQDAGEYKFRLSQLDLINYAIQVLTAELWKDVNQANYKQMFNDSMSYKDADGNSDDQHDWEKLTADPVFINPSKRTNTFQEYADYFTKNSGKDTASMRKDFTDFVTEFTNLRTTVMQKMLSDCK